MFQFKIMGSWLSGYVWVSGIVAALMLPQSLFADPKAPESKSEQELVQFQGENSNSNSSSNISKPELIESEVELAEVSRINLTTIEIRTAHDYVLHVPVMMPDEIAKSFHELSPELRIKFLENRITTLKLAASILDQVELGIGAGTYSMGKVKQFGRKVKNGFMRAFSKSITSDTKQMPRTLRENTQIALQEIVNELDLVLWEKSYVVANRNEANFSVGIYGNAQVGVLKYGVGGLIGVGFNIGVNYQSGESTFETFFDVEWFKSAAPFVVSLAVVPKIGGELAFNQFDTGARRLKGAAFYPPGLPGYVTSCENSISFGVSTNALGPLGAKIGPLADSMCYVNSLHRFVFYRKKNGKPVSKFLRNITAKFVPIELIDLEMEAIKKAKAALKSCADLFVGKRE